MVDSNVLKTVPNQTVMMLTQDTKTGKHQFKIVTTTNKPSVVVDKDGTKIDINELIDDKVSVFLNPIH